MTNKAQQMKKKIKYTNGHIGNSLECPCFLVITYTTHWKQLYLITKPDCQLTLLPTLVKHLL